MPINWPEIRPADDPFAEWNGRFAVPGIVAMVMGEGGLPKILIESAAGSAEIYLHGAHLTSWCPAGMEDVLFLSAASKWETGKAIRGGIPICFPWFRAKADDPKAPAHGFARTSEWTAETASLGEDAVMISFSLKSSEATRRWWPHEFTADFKVTVGKTLALALTIRNHGDEAIRFEEALHAYHRVSDVEAIEVLGLAGAAYLDNFDGNQAKVQPGDVRFAGRRDDAFASAATPLIIADEGMKRRIQIAKRGSQTTVVWNPWQQAAAAMADLGDQQWREFACVEAANILDAAVLLMPGEEHVLAVDISVIPLA